ncbi:MAG: ATPase domain-containing protein, partial [Candidatus Aenigmarchaeota archaeon]|nr:ATPase domain-containing protein [Candidatus Aenigmarchaeota archaeon]
MAKRKSFMSIFKRPAKKAKVVKKIPKKKTKIVSKKHVKKTKINKIKKQAKPVKIIKPKKIKIKNIPKKIEIKKVPVKKLKIEKPKKIKKVPKKALKKIKIKKIDKKASVKIDGKIEHKIDHVQTFIPGFDNLFEHGIPKGNAVLVEGGPGVGKTIFCLQLAYNACKKGKKVLYMSFEEPEENLIQHMKNFGWNPDAFIEKDLLRIKRFNALDVARSVEALLSEAKKELLIEIQPVFFPP